MVAHSKPEVPNPDGAACAAANCGATCAKSWYFCLEDSLHSREPVCVC